MEEFIEVQFLGEKKMEFKMKAQQYPEKLKIMDMIALTDPYIEMPDSQKSVFN